MQPILFNGSNAILEEPEGWDHDKDGPCSDLPVLIQELPSGQLSYTSIWRPTDEERELLANGSGVLINMVGAQPAFVMAVTYLPCEQLVQVPEMPTESATSHPQPNAE